MKRMLATLSVVLACASFPACASKQNTGALIGAGTGAAAGAAIAHNNAVGAVVGGLVGGLIGGAIGHHMDQNDQNRLAQTFSQDNRPCRRFTLQGTVEGSTSTEPVTGTACRRSDGAWEIVSQG